MGETLLDRLEKRLPLAKRQTFKRMVEDGRVLVNGAPARRIKQEISSGDRVQLLDRAAKMEAEEDLPLRIIYEDSDVIVIDKPVGLLTSTVPREKRPTALAAVRQHVERRESKARVGLIHRLDRDASGLLVFSKNDAAYRALKDQFFDHSVDRVYSVIVHGVPRPRRGRIESNLVERAEGTVHSTKQAGKGQRAVTDYQVLADDGKRALLRVTLQTGRKHQIRVHLSERGHAVVGDRMYGKDRQNRLMLAAVLLAFTHPRMGKRVTFQIPPLPW